MERTESLQSGPYWAAILGMIGSLAPGANRANSQVDVDIRADNEKDAGQSGAVNDAQLLSTSFQFMSQLLGLPRCNAFQ
jgi:hypothetical protein